MTGDLVPRSDVDSWVDILGPVGDLAGKISSTEFVPKSLRGRAPAVAAAILAGRERGLPPMVSLAGIDVIDGKPALSARLLGALAYRAGHRITVIENTDRAAEVKIERADGLAEATVRWTIADAQRAGLAGKRNWQQYTRQMLFARALTECANIVCPDVAMGLDVDSGAVDNPPPATSTVVQLGRSDADPTRDTPGMSASSPRESREKVETYSPVASEIENETTASDTPERGAVSPPDPAPDDTVQDAVIVPDEPPITPAQMRKLGALIGAWEAREQTKLDREERRSLIRNMAGVETLASAKDLTSAQASAAIDALEMALAVLPPEAEDEA